MDVVKKVRQRLESEGMFNETAITDLRSNLEKKRENTSFFMFEKKKELNQTITALTYLLENN